MTSASELFYNRRSRFGRSSDPFGVGSDLGSPTPVDRANRRHRHPNSPGGNHTRRDRIDPDGCDPVPRALHHPRQPPLPRPLHPPQERESTRLEDGGHQFSSGNGSHSGSHINVRDRLRVSGNDRLPGAVLLARERLLQRLRGVTLSASRRSNRSSSTSHRNDIAIGDDFRLVDAGDWETEISTEWLATVAPLTNSISQQTSKRPPGLTQEAMSRLCFEVFNVPGESDQQGMSRALMECSICLESFSEGDELIRLPCGHRYHFYCLEPWIRACGDCPYCRRGIDVTLHGVKENREC
ncbi:hypothetical protein DH2020_029326 [Rehmannia glutinosa]|uniref:RING-type domain-containing protein n=1 Tax=Rehmannia glutinosa TaxID=99300 RepID=A0ABR0VRH3_REHGL